MKEYNIKERIPRTWKIVPQHIIQSEKCPPPPHRLSNDFWENHPPQQTGGGEDTMVSDILTGMGSMVYDMLNLFSWLFLELL